MNIIKEMRLARTEPATKDREERQVGCIGIIRLNHYGSQFNWLLEIVNEAKKDFPHLKDEDIKVVHYGGIYYKGTFGVEFHLPDSTTLPKDYSEIHEIEFLL